MIGGFLTRADLEERLNDVGISLRNVAAGIDRFSGGRAGGAPRIDVERGDDSGRLVLVVTVYALNEDGKRYFDTNSDNQAAVEVRRFNITSDWRFVPIASAVTLVSVTES